MMRKKFPIGVQSFEVLRTENYVYVDKTDLIYELSGQHICFLCRPRRFGKSLTLSTLEAYFNGQKDLFDGLKIRQLEKKWEVYPVFHLDFNASDYTNPDTLNSVLDAFVSEQERRFSVEKGENVGVGIRFAKVLKTASEQSGKRCVVLVDEYDKPMLDAMGTMAEQTNRDILRNFYSVFKLADACLRFVMLTGVTKFSQVNVFSGFNQPYDVSFVPQYEALCGITDEEIDTFFSEDVDELAETNGTTSESIRCTLRKLYDGYHFSAKLTNIYNPFSLFNVFATKTLRDFWFSTGTPLYLVRLLSGGQINISDLLSDNYEQSFFTDNSMDDGNPLPILYQSGYLTVKDIISRDGDFPLYRLDYPNLEVKRGFVSMLCNDYFEASENVMNITNK